MPHTDQETPEQKRCKNCKCKTLVSIPIDRLPDWKEADVEIQFVFPFFYEREKTDPIK